MWNLDQTPSLVEWTKQQQTTIKTNKQTNSSTDVFGDKARERSNLSEHSNHTCTPFPGDNISNQCRDTIAGRLELNVSHHKPIYIAGNPVLVLGQEVIGLKKDILRQSLPFFSVFGSGDPQPEPSDYSWYFNGDAIFVNGSVDSSVVDVFDRVTYSRITLKQRIDYSVEGTYVSVVTTTAGQTSVLIKVDVQGQLCLGQQY